MQEISYHFKFPYITHVQFETFVYVAILFFIITSYRNADTTNEELRGGMERYYFENRDLRFLLDLLADSSGISSSLRVLALFDQEFNNSFKPGDIKFTEGPCYKRKGKRNVAIGEGNLLEQEEQDVYDLTVTFEHARALNGVFSHMKDISLIYTIELIQDTQKIYVIPVQIESQKKYANGDLGVAEKGDIEATGLALIDKTGASTMGSQSNQVKELETIEPLRYLSVSKEYAIRVNTIVNGKTLAYTTEWIAKKFKWIFFLHCRVKSKLCIEIFHFGQNSKLCPGFSVII